MQTIGIGPVGAGDQNSSAFEVAVCRISCVEQQSVWKCKDVVGTSEKTHDINNQINVLYKETIVVVLTFGSAPILSKRA